MNEYEGSLKRVFEAESADIAFRLQDVDTSKVINHEDEDPEFYCEFTRVIDDVTLAQWTTTDEKIPRVQLRWDLTAILVLNLHFRKVVKERCFESESQSE
jgi:hypothetical protein